MAAPTPLEKCIESLIEIFHRYADVDKDGTSLSKKEFKTLVETELPNFMKAQKNPKLVSEMMSDLDMNKDQKVDFVEFLALINGLSMTCEKLASMKEKKGKKGDARDTVGPVTDGFKAFDEDPMVNYSCAGRVTMAAPTPLEKCIESLIEIFHRYADVDKDGTSLSKKEFKTLVETELPNFMKAQKNPKLVSEMMSDLDMNKDQKVDFVEFLTLINGLSMTCEKLASMKEKKGKK
ncbi:protein S100-A10b [Eucyclogobius newberryi]|uniref:protein S100-A10b n=1 Tax=Eucyclogobius newberryi TaxID=166745 RepID=UPI003B5C7393